jgi:UTP-glucose-1-phosphate uridylyltransferase
VHNMVEKPAPEKAPTNLSIVGRYILTYFNWVPL